MGECAHERCRQNWALRRTRDRVFSQSLPKTTDQHEAWTLSETEHGLLTASLRGDFDEASAERLDLTLRDRLAAVPPGSMVLLFDLNEMRRCSVGAREVLAGLQRHVGGLARRTAWVTNRPIFRGIALWVCHCAPDSNARTFPTAAHANGWLESSGAREILLRESAGEWVGRLRGRAIYAKEAS